MKCNSSLSSYSLKVSPLGGRLPEGIPIDLDLRKGELIKHEPVTLIWRNIPINGKQTVVKMYRRGLLVRLHSLTTHFRVKREFDGLSHMETLGIPCSVPMFWCHGYFGPYGWGEILVTEWVAQSQPLKDLLATKYEVSSPLDLSSLFANMAMMHAAGVHHGILRTKNILVKNYPEHPDFLFIDLPRFHRFPQDIRGKRMARHDLMSLCEGLFPHFSEDMVRLWLSAYGIPESERADLLIQLKRFHSTATLRKLAAWEFDVRDALARFLSLYRPSSWWLLK
jgi:tRNA A-37 threonylcarbamoyl transferase component Bud32